MAQIVVRDDQQVVVRVGRADVVEELRMLGIGIGEDKRGDLLAHDVPKRPRREHNFIHATAKNLLQQPWQNHPYALSVEEWPWGETHLWSPHVIFHDNMYYMYYCAGGTDHTRYKIHLATSTDLWTWKRHPKNPMVEDGYDARDPFVMRVGGKWVMYYTATSSPEGGNYVVACVTSDDLVTWGDRRIVFTDPHKGKSGGPTASPFVVQRGDSFYLIIGPRGAYGKSDVFRSPDPFQWQLSDEVGHIQAHPAEIVRDLDGQWYVSKGGWYQGGVLLAPLTWLDEEAAAPEPSPLEDAAPANATIEKKQ